MKINVTAVVVSLSMALTASQTYADDQQVVDANDLKNNTNNSYNCSGLACILKMATFSSEKYATRYKENLATKTNQPVYIERDKKNKNLFHVFVGPFNSFAKMTQSLADLTSRNLKSVTHTAESVKVSPTFKNTLSTPTVNKATTKVQSNTKESSLKVADITAPITKPMYALANVFKFTHQKTSAATNTNHRRTVEISTAHKKTNITHSSQSKPTKHEQILASQADYPINQKPKVDAKGNIIPIFKAGPYVGASGGVLSAIGKTPSTTAYQAFSGTLSIGAGRMFAHRFYMAGEFYLGDNIKAKNFNSGLLGYGIQSGFNYGGDFIPGFMITDNVLAYLRIGGMRALFSSIPSTRPEFVRNFGREDSRAFTRRIDLIRNGWQVGVGSQTNLYKNLDGRAEFVYSQFQGAIIEENKGMISQVNIGLVYKFTDSLRRS